MIRNQNVAELVKTCAADKAVPGIEKNGSNEVNKDMETQKQSCINPSL